MCCQHDKAEIIIVDAPSSSDQTKMLCDYHDVQYLRSSSTGRSVQMNEGANIARGDVLIFMHADVRPPSRLCQYITDTLAQDVDAGYFSYRFDRSSWLLRINSYFTKYKGAFAGGGDQCLFIKSALFRTLGGFNIDYPIMEDFELYDRLKKHGADIKIIDQPLIVSARKYEDRSWLRVNIANLVVFSAFRLGIGPHKLQTWYKGLLG